MVHLTAKWSKDLPITPIKKFEPREEPRCDQSKIYLKPRLSITNYELGYMDMGINIKYFMVKYRYARSKKKKKKLYKDFLRTIKYNRYSLSLLYSTIKNVRIIN